MQVHAVDLRPGALVRHNGQIATVTQWNILRNDRRQFVQLRLKEIEGGRIHDLKEHSDSRFELLESSTIDLSHSYRDGNEEVFYTSDGVEYRVPAVAAEEALKWPIDLYKGLLVDGVLTAIDLPNTVVVTVAETAPPVKGSSNLMKPATLENGVEIKVSGLVASGDRVRVDPRTLEFKERA
jgi:elongation factor P